VGVDIDVLIKAFDMAVDRFVQDLDGTSELRERVEPRLQLVFEEWRPDDPEALYRQITQQE
jgi:hypothetical protein